MEIEKQNIDLDQFISEFEENITDQINHQYNKKFAEKIVYGYSSFVFLYSIFAMLVMPS